MILPFIPFPTRIVSPGALTIATLASESFGGVNGRQLRVAFIVTNTDSTNAIQLLTSNGRLFATVPAGSSYALSTSAPLSIYNPNGTSIVVNVCELFPDIEGSRGDFANQVHSAGGGATAGGGSAPAAGYGSGSPGGGGTTGHYYQP